MLTPIEQSFIDDVIEARYPSLPSEEAAVEIAAEKPMMVAGRATGVAQPPESVGAVASDIGKVMGGVTEMGAATGKGMAQGFVGLPGDIEGLTRTVINMLGGNVDENTKLPTTDEIKAWLDQFPVTRVGSGKNPMEKVGEFLAPGGYVEGAKTAVKGTAKAAKSIKGAK